MKTEIEELQDQILWLTKRLRRHELVAADVAETLPVTTPDGIACVTPIAVMYRQRDHIERLQRTLEDTAAACEHWIEVARKNGADILSNDPSSATAEPKGAHGNR